MADKYYRIGDAAALLGLKAYVLRFWESEFPELRPVRTGKGQRRYTEENVARLQQIRYLLHDQGLTIEGARRVLAGESALSLSGSGAGSGSGPGSCSGSGSGAGLAPTQESFCDTVPSTACDAHGLGPAQLTFFPLLQGHEDSVEGEQSVPLSVSSAVFSVSSAQPAPSASSAPSAFSTPSVPSAPSLLPSCRSGVSESQAAIARIADELRALQALVRRT